MKHIFCCTEYEGINLDLINALYPSLNSITIYELSMIDSRFLNDIIAFIQKRGSNHTLWIHFYISKEYGIGNIPRDWMFIDKWTKQILEAFFTNFSVICFTYSV